MLFGIGLWELAVVVIIVIVFIRPDDLPAFFRRVGKWYAELRKSYDAVMKLRDEILRADRDDDATHEPEYEESIAPYEEAMKRSQKEENTAPKTRAKKTVSKRKPASKKTTRKSSRKRSPKTPEK